MRISTGLVPSIVMFVLKSSGEECSCSCVARWSWSKLPALPQALHVAEYATVRADDFKYLILITSHHHVTAGRRPLVTWVILAANRWKRKQEQHNTSHLLPHPVALDPQDSVHHNNSPPSHRITNRARPTYHTIEATMARRRDSLPSAHSLDGTQIAQELLVIQQTAAEIHPTTIKPVHRDALERFRIL